jgi:mRNA interferase MazF
MPSEKLKRHKLRPGLIISKDFNNKRLHDIIIAICTSNISKKREPTQYLIEGEEIMKAGIKVVSVVKCESLLTISKSMVIKVTGKLSDKGIQEVNKCLKDAIGLGSLK